MFLSVICPSCYSSEECWITKMMSIEHGYWISIDHLDVWKERMKEKKKKNASSLSHLTRHSVLLHLAHLFLSFFLSLSSSLRNQNSSRIHHHVRPVHIRARPPARVIAVIQYGARTGNCSRAESHLTSHGSVQRAENMIPPLSCSIFYRECACERMCVWGGRKKKKTTKENMRADELDRQ